MVATAFILGLLGSFHCVGMCGPIAFLLPVDRSNSTKKFFQVASYHLGRLFTYAIIGLIFSILGKSFDLFGLQQQLSIAVGILMILAIVLPARVFNTYNGSRWMYTFVAKVKSSLGANLKKKSPDAFFTVGFLNGLLPCGLVYIAVFASLAAGNALEGILYMVAFGVGTLPLMTAAIYVGNFLSRMVKQKIIKLIPVVVVAMGVLFIIRGLGLGIPYVSPSNGVAQQEISAQHSCH